MLWDGVRTWKKQKRKWGSMKKHRKYKMHRQCESVRFSSNHEVIGGAKFQQPHVNSGQIGQMPNKSGGLL